MRIARTAQEGFRVERRGPRVDTQTSAPGSPLDSRHVTPDTLQPAPRAHLWSIVFRCLVGASLVLAGCARFHSQPLSPAETAERLESRSLTNGELKLFLERNLQRELVPWPPESWDLDTLVLAACYYQPGLAVARAHLAVTQGGEVTAAQRPNPSLNATPGYDTTTSIPSPWIPLTFVDIPIETAGKRKYRRAQAVHLSEAARLNLATAAWLVRSAVRSSLIELTAAERRLALLQQQLAFEEQAASLLDEQVKAGAKAASEVSPVRLALTRLQLDVADARRLRVGARNRLAEAIGVPVRALDEVKLATAQLKPRTSPAELASPEVRRTALCSRPDVLGALAEYAATESALQLEIAKQYPDLRLSPGYQYDQGDNKWSLGLTVDLPILNQNQGPIAEATAKRRQAAANFTAVQSKALAELDLATQTLAVSEKNSATLQALAAEQSRRRDDVEAQLRAGAVEPLDLLSAQVEWSAAELVQLDGHLKLEQALGALEDAVQRPLFGSGAAAPAPNSELLQIEPDASK